MSPAKVRIRFHKGGDLRFVSHHDLMRCFERMLRRARLPYHSTQGFHPKPRLVFALSLGLGIVGREEVVELVLAEPLPADEVLQRLRQQAPPGLDILDVHAIDPRASAQVRRVVYHLPLVEPVAGLAERARNLLQADTILIERTKPQRKSIDLRPYLNDLRVRDDGLEIDIRVTPTGTARPDEIARQLGLGSQLDAGAVIERTVLEIADEITELTSGAVEQPEPLTAGCTPADLSSRREPYEA
jgi:radical SAM-linked protein